MKIRKPHGTGNRFKNYNKAKQEFVTIPCGICYACLSNKRNQWTMRLMQEARASETCKFITLTYDDTHLIEANNELQKRDVQLFLKKVRKHGYKLRYYAVGEYGTETHRPHYHLLVFNLDVTGLDELQNIWGKGFVHIGEVNQSSIHYCTYYHLGLKDSYGGGKRNPEFVLMSRNPGIGYNYLEDRAIWNIDNKFFYAVQEGGQKVSLPRYYSNKIFTENERERNNKENQRLNDLNDIENLSRLQSLGNEIGLSELSKIEHFNKKIINLKKRVL